MRPEVQEAEEGQETHTSPRVIQQELLVQPGLLKSLLKNGSACSCCKSTVDALERCPTACKRRAALRVDLESTLEEASSWQHVTPSSHPLKPFQLPTKYMTILHLNNWEHQITHARVHNEHACWCRGAMLMIPFVSRGRCHPRMHCNTKLQATLQLYQS
ncbi:hypothetical protein M8818_000038 [Zalaria obscura]|uniref:Uncharacterized protein n=1 Tax=Zalaria obscura TaxID=2024903 RepID=A0ACC3SNX9_9PEZI